MNLTPNLVAILAALRDIHMDDYFRVTMLLWSDREVASDNRSVIAAERSGLSEGSSYGLEQLLRSDEYQELVALLHEIDPQRSQRVQTMLETREYEERLADIKRKSMEEYFDNLRVVTKQELYDAVKNGTVVNAIGPDGRPLPICSDENYSASFLYQPVATAKLDSGILAEFLGEFSGATDVSAFSPQGLRLRQVVIDGDQGLNLNWVRIPFPLGFQGCDFYHWVSAEYAEMPWLNFENCDFTPIRHKIYRNAGAFNASNLRVTHDLKFWECTGFSQLFIPDAQIGSFVLRGVKSNVDSSNESDLASDKTGLIRTVVQGARFEEIVITSPDEGEAVSPFIFAVDGNPPSIHRVGGDLKSLSTMLIEQSASQRVWEEFADALVRSGEKVEATALRIAFKRWENSQLPWYRRVLNTVFLDWTVGYLYRPFKIAWSLLSVLLVTAILAIVFHDDLMKSPLANEAIPASWLQQLWEIIPWSLMYSLDSTFSPLSLGQVETMWPSSPWVLLLFTLLKGLSIIFLALFIASATTFVSKKSN